MVKQYSLQSLIDILAKLRSPQGCPWDREQTHHSLIKHLIEETYEVIEAIEEQNPQALTEELGDVLLQIVFHAQIGSENKQFTMDDVIAVVSEKMIRRHPHVFANTKADSIAEVLTNWEAIKEKEKSQRENKSILEGVPRQLPALMRAEKIQAKATKVGFEWDDVSGAISKIEEEIREFKSALERRNQADMIEELGDILFSIVNTARYLNIDSEQALNATTNKFINRFQQMERMAQSSEKTLSEMSLAEMEQLWQKAKKDS